MFGKFKYLITIITLLTLLSPSMVFAQGGDWNIVGNSVYVDDENIYLAVTPHTLKTSGWVEFELISKVYSGEVDVVFGFPEGTAQVRKPQVWSQNVAHTEYARVDVEKTRTITMTGIVSQTPLDWATFEGEPDIGNRNNIYLFEVQHDYLDEFGIFKSEILVAAFNSFIKNDTEVTITFNYTVSEKQPYIEYYADWKPLNTSTFSVDNYNYKGMGEWWYAKMDASIVSGTKYTVRCWVELPFGGLDRVEGKYFLGVKPSGETIPQAIANGHAYWIDPWWDETWGFRVPITINGDNVTEELTDFPVLLYLSDSSGIGSDNVSFVFEEIANDANRKKIAVVLDDDATECYVEIERWDNANKQAWLWVKVPTIATGDNTTIWLYYDASHADNDAHVGDIGDAVSQNVWSSSYVSVYHFAEGAGNAVDSVGNNDGAVTGADYGATGQIDKAYSYLGDDRVIAPDDPSMNWNTELTVIQWVKVDNTGDTYEAFSNKYASGTPEREWSLFKNHGIGGLYIHWGDPADGTFEGTSISVNSILTSGVWRQIGFVFDNGAVSFINNGKEEADTPTTVPAALYNGTADLWMGERVYNDYDLLGDLDESQIATIARSFGWISSQYQSEIDDFVWWGEEDTNVVIPSAPTNFILTQVGLDTVTANWTMGVQATTTVIRGKEGSYPLSITDGFEVYNGAGTSENFTGLHLGIGNYFYRAWGYNALGYSVNYVENKIGGVIMYFGVLVLLAVVVSFISIKTSYYLLRFLAGVAWIGLAIYWNAEPIFATGSDTHTIFYLLFWGLGIGMMFMIMWRTSKDDGGSFNIRVPRVFGGTSEADELASARMRGMSYSDRRDAYAQRVNGAIRGGRTRRKR